MSKRVHFSTSKPKVAPKAATKDPKKKGERRIRKKPQWDTTVSDLTVHRLSKAELERRHTNAKSKNAETACHEMYEKAKDDLRLDSSGNRRPSPKPAGSTAAAAARKALALRRALQGKGLHQVLAESDRALAAVKDIFGDDPKRYIGRPNVTVAPHIISDKKSLERTILESQLEGAWPTAVASPGGIRDESVLELAPKKPALNDLPPPELNLDDSESLLGCYHTPSHTHRQPQTSYRPTLDLRRFQQLIQQEEESNSTGSAKGVDHPLQVAADTGTQARNNARASVAVLDRGRQTGTETPDQEQGREGQRDLDESLTGISELSSIPPAAGNLRQADSQSRTFFDSEASTGVLVAPPLRPQRLHPRPPARVSVNESTGERSGGGDVRVQQPQPPVQHHHHHHPLHTTHRIPAQQRQPLEGEGSEGRAGGAETETETERGGEGDGGRREAGVKIQGTSSRSPHQEHASVVKVKDDLQVLEKLVQGLEAQLQEYEQEMGCSVSFETPALSHPGTFSGITASLLASVTKLTHYLKQSEAQLRGEIEVRGQLLHTMTEQQNLMDAMTTDMVKIQEENISLRAEMRDSKRTTDDCISKLQEELAVVSKKLSSLALPPAGPHPLHSPPTFLYPAGPQAHTLTAPSHQACSRMAATSPLCDSSSLHLPSVAERPEHSLPMRATDTTSKEAEHHSSLTNSAAHTLLTGTPTHLPQGLPAPPSTLPQSAGAGGLSSLAPHSSSSGVIYAQVSPLPYPGYGYTVSPAAITAATHHTSTSLPLYSSFPATAPLKHVHFTPTPTSAGKNPHFIHTQPSVSSADDHHHPPQTTPHVTANPTPAVTSPSQYAPSPPPLSVALQVPTLSTTVGHSSLSSQTFPLYHQQVTSPAEPVDFTRPYFDTSWLLKDGSSNYKFAPTATSHLPRQHTQQSTPSGLRAPDLSIVSSLPEADAAASKSKTAPENSRGSDDDSLPNFLDVQASAEKMSTVARSVLQELSQRTPMTAGTCTTSAPTSTTGVVNSERAPLLAIGVPESLGRLPASSLQYDATSSAGAYSTTRQPVTAATKDSELVPTTTSSLQPSSLQPSSLLPSSLPPSSLQPSSLPPSSLQPSSLLPSSLQPSSHLGMQQFPPSGTTAAVAQEGRGVPPSSKMGWFALSSHISH